MLTDERKMMPLFGGGAHGQWRELPADPCGRHYDTGSLYTIHVAKNPTPDPCSLNDPLWFSCTEDISAVIRYCDVEERYLQKHHRRGQQ